MSEKYLTLQAFPSQCHFLYLSDAILKAKMLQGFSFGKGRVQDGQIGL